MRIGKAWKIWICPCAKNRCMDLGIRTCVRPSESLMLPPGGFITVFVSCPMTVNVCRVYTGVFAARRRSYSLCAVLIFTATWYDEANVDVSLSIYVGVTRETKPLVRIQRTVEQSKWGLRGWGWIAGSKLRDRIKSASTCACLSRCYGIWRENNRILKSALGFILERKEALRPQGGGRFVYTYVVPMHLCSQEFLNISIFLAKSNLT